MAPGIQAPSDSKTRLLIRAVIIEHALLALASVAGMVLLWQGIFASQAALWMRILIGVALLAITVASAAASYLLRGGRRSGRTISLAVNYLCFLFCFFGAMHLLGVFTGIDALAGTFGQGIYWIVGMLAGYLVAAAGDRFSTQPEISERFRQIGKYIAIVCFIILLIQVGLFQGLLFILGQLNQALPLALVCGSILFGFTIWALWREPSAQALHTNTFQSEALDGYLFLSPNLLGFLLFFAGPLLLSLYVSFTDWDAFGSKNWIGLQNYAKIFNLVIQPLQNPNQVMTEVLNFKVYDELTRFTLFGNSFIIGAEDKLFWIALGNTLLFCLLAVPLSIIPAIVLSNILNSKIPGMKFFRAVYFLPSIAATVGVALIWQWLYNAAVGWINYFITTVVNFANNSLGLVWVDPQMRWLSDSNTALLAIIVMAAWQTMGFNTVLFLAGLQNIPKELYEAAIVDGAGRWAKFWKITLPLLAPTTFFVVTTTTIQALQVFEQVFIMTNPPGAPNNSTLTVVLYLYQSGFQNFRQGYASAVAWVLFLVIFAVTLIQFRGQRNAGAYDM